MIGYVTVGTNDLPRAAQFYDALAAEMGTGRMMEFDTFIAWGTPGGGCGIAATKPFDGAAATVGNGVMVAIEARDQDQVDRLLEVAQTDPIAIDLETQTVTTPFQDRFSFEIDPFRKHCLLNGLDDIGLTLEKKASIDSFEKKQAAAQPWL